MLLDNVLHGPLLFDLFTMRLLLEGSDPVRRISVTMKTVDYDENIPNSPFYNGLLRYKDWIPNETTIGQGDLLFLPFFDTVFNVLEEIVLPTFSQGFLTSILHTQAGRDENLVGEHRLKALFATAN